MVFAGISDEVVEPGRVVIQRRHAAHAAATLVGEGRRRDMQDAMAGLSQAMAEVHILEENGVELLIKATQAAEDLPADHEAGSGHLGDLANRPVGAGWGHGRRAQEKTATPRSP